MILNENLRMCRGVLTLLGIRLMSVRFSMRAWAIGIHDIWRKLNLKTAINLNLMFPTLIVKVKMEAEVFLYSIACNLAASRLIQQVQNKVRIAVYILMPAQGKMKNFASRLLIEERQAPEGYTFPDPAPNGKNKYISSKVSLLGKKVIRTWEW